ncbi:outer membrane lipoprotein carrier protein LolA [Neisseria leonii]|uniref:Outer membrane lipoprotein carrier protein LolA n=1 Tax=Neisseria leonii TaxID=2995413 RepID=A0A9X4IDZ7_9NEIS|nr:outer membrane lipoprotein carrier protein LolA [Neisseria sp. 51.81]MDD9328211.1 outer membrane lipoprotein carrier protein LolA [Neisseria sp. 51.81]
MKKILTTAALMLASPLLWAFSAAELAQILQKPASVQGAFSQQRYLKTLPKPMSASGRFVLLPRKGLIWHMQQPFDNRLRVRADGIMQWDGKNWTGGAGNAAQGRQVGLFLDLIGGNVQALEKQFDLNVSGTPQKWTLRLMPKTALMKQIFTSVEIEGDSVVRRIGLNEKQGDRTVMRFHRVQIDGELDAAVKASFAD